MVNNFRLWSIKRDKSEAMFYRRFATILDTLLADISVILADGETILQSSFIAVAMNKAIFHTGDLSQAYGRKIDLILKCSSDASVDISSNEWKNLKVSKSVKVHRQSRNLRLNSTNLFSLDARFEVKSTVAALDFVETPDTCTSCDPLTIVHDPDVVLLLFNWSPISSSPQALNR